jgi:geranylgeranyl diphosphate synthase type II
MMHEPFPSFLAGRRAAIEARLHEALAPRAGFPERLREAMRYSLLAPGKRLRPLLVLLAAEACGSYGGGDPWSAALAVEMVHVYSLIHDDLPAMDDDDLRRGLPTCHVRYGEGLAILAGDALLTEAFALLAAAYPDPALCLELSLAAGASGMVGGQVDDLAMEAGQSERSLAKLEAVHLRKTGALIRSCLRLGARAACCPGTPPPDVLERLDAYGRCLGLVFQITDDLLDVTGQSADTGKRVNKDAARNKLTYPGLLGIEESRQRAAQLVEEARRVIAPLAAPRLEELLTFVLHRDR